MFSSAIPMRHSIGLINLVGFGVGCRSLDGVPILYGNFSLTSAVFVSAGFTVAFFPASSTSTTTTAGSDSHASILSSSCVGTGEGVFAFNFGGGTFAGFGASIFGGFGRHCSHLCSRHCDAVMRVLFGRGGKEHILNLIIKIQIIN